ncbi:MAG: hypothetical protein LAO04_11860 [Acidobacteriia bacterium]|nr:hypothetical protein [Terriglobia bacterium]
MSRVVMSGFIAAIVMGVLSSPHSSARAEQQRPAAAQDRKLPDENTPRELFYPRYSLREGYESSLSMMDIAQRPIEFTVSVHSLSGATVTSNKMTIRPSEELTIDVRDLLADLNVDYRGDFLEGTLSINFKGKGNPLAGRMVIAGPHERQNIGPVWSMGEFGQDMLPPVLNNYWHDLGGTRDAWVTVSNMSSQPAVGDVHFDIAGKRYSPAPLRFAPYQTHQLSVTEILAALEITPYQATLGGLSIVPRGQPTLVASGYMTDSDTGAQTALDFPLPQKQPSSALHTTGIPIGRPTAGSPFAGFKDANFTPHLYLRNLLDAEQTVRLTVEVPTQNGAQLVNLAPFRLPAFTTLDVRLDDYYNELPLPLPFVSLRAAFNGPGGSVIGTVKVFNEATAQVTSIGSANEGNGYAGSLASYWGFDDDTDFVVFLTDMGEKDCRVAFQIESAGKEYIVPNVKLMPHETRWYSLRDLRDQQIPDLSGNMIPKDAVEGRLFYLRMDNVPMMGRVSKVPQIPK